MIDMNVKNIFLSIFLMIILSVTGACSTQKLADESNNNWKVYDDSTLRIEVKYPADWVPEKLVFESWSIKSAEVNDTTVYITSPGYFEAEFTQFTISRLNYDEFNFSEPGYKSIKLPNDMSAYYWFGRNDQWGTENMYYIKKEGYVYLLDFFIQSNKGGRNGFTEKEIELEQKILVTFKFVDSATIEQSKLSKYLAEN